MGTGAPVAIPIGHMAVTGQSQQSGKTTTLEALISRSGLRAVAFVTKRGEGSFTDGLMIPPYFSERSDWQFVEAILESTMRQRLKFERAWIVRATKGAHSLADVQRNVRRLQEQSKRSMDADIYMLLGEYLDLVVPLLANLPAADKVNLVRGLNVMDLAAYPAQLQALVIQSVLAWIYQHETDVIAVIPEAWEFVPQKRGSPVKLAAVDLIRKGAGLHDFIWLDSQDIAGVEKEIVRQASVWLLGVQREANEVRRTLAHIPAGVKKPKPEDIAGLGIGQFWACWHGHAVKTYVQPAWLAPAVAQAVAMGAAPPRRPPAEKPIWPGHPHVDEAIRAGRAAPRPPLKTGDVVGGTPRWGGPPVVTFAELDRRLDAQEKGDDDMGKDVEAKLDQLIKLMTAQQHHQPAPSRIDTAHAATSPGADEEALYQRIKSRLMKEAPALIKLATFKPEIEVTVERQVIELDGSTLRGRLAKLIAEGFFDTGKANRDAVKELARTGKTAHDSNVLKEIRELISMRFLFRTPGDRFQATTEAKVNLIEKGGR